jgi:hypothetical protein
VPIERQYYCFSYKFELHHGLAVASIKQRIIQIALNKRRALRRRHAVGSNHNVHQRLVAHHHRRATGHCGR